MRTSSGGAANKPRGAHSGRDSHGVAAPQATPVTVWSGCYDKQWVGVLSPDCFKHPAKFSRSLIERILDYGCERGYWEPGMRLGDLFGGVACGGVVAADKGYQWIGSELEAQFVETGNRMIAGKKEKWTQMGKPVPVLVKGDSRRFAEVVRSTLAAIVTSPPFTGTRAGAQGIALEGYKGEKRTYARMKDRTFLGEGGDRTDDNIEKLTPGDIDGALTSPPYDTISAGAGGLNHLPAKSNGQQSGRSHAGSQDTDQRYGSDPKQIAKLKRAPLDAAITSPPYLGGGHHTDIMQGGNKNGRGQGPMSGYGKSEEQISQLKEGAIDAAVTSPPYERNKAIGHIGADKFGDPGKFAETMAASGKGHSASPQARQRQFERDRDKTYGNSDGQIGRAAGETYWAAMKKCYASMFEALRPGGYAAIVVKDYVRNKKRVPLCDDTMRLLEYVGFEPVERIHAMLVEETRHDDLFEGEVVKKKERKSFFRRLQEQKGSPRIDYEEVLFVRKPLEKGSQSHDHLRSVGHGNKKSFKGESPQDHKSRPGQDAESAGASSQPASNRQGYHS
jgi:DNA modification methylase